MSKAKNDSGSTTDSRLESVESVPEFAAARAKLQAVQARQADVRKHLEQVSRQLGGLPKGREAVTYAARTLLETDSLDLTRAADIAGTARTLQQQLAVLTEAEKLQKEVVEEERRKASRVVCQEHFAEHRDLVLEMLGLIERLCDVQAKEVAFCERLKSGGVIITSPMFEERPPIEKIMHVREYFILGLKRARYLDP